MSIVNIFSALRSSYIEFYASAGFKIRIAAWIGAFALPAYYFVWNWLKPQPFESLTYRLVGAALCIAVGSSAFWPKKWAPYELLLAYITTIYCLPFFITYMTLMNGFTPVWQLTSIAAVLYLVFLFDVINWFFATAVGIVLAVIAFLLSDATVSWDPTIPEFALVIFFATLSLIFLNYGERLIIREKISAAATMAGQVAHEIRTPLLAIRFEVEKVGELFSKLKKVSAQEKQNNNFINLPVPQNVMLDKCETSLTRINDQAKAAGVVIDMILTSLGQHGGAVSDVNQHNMSDTVQDAMKHYYFRSNQKGAISLNLNDDFVYKGSNLLVQHVIFNLLKNALRAIARKGSGKIAISLHSEAKQNKLVFSDTGVGIPANTVPYVFVPFYTTEHNNAGTGVGLSFCHQVVTSMGGTIECDSKEGVGSSFTISLPSVAANETTGSTGFG